MRDKFAIFVREHQDMVFSTAMRITSDGAESEDIAQQVFLQAYRQFDTLCDHCNPGGWLRLTARNLSINHVKRYVNRWQFFDTVTGIMNGSEETAPVDDEEAGLLYENTDKLKKILAELVPKFRIPLVLFYYEGLAYHEIAAELKCSEGKVKTDIFRAKKTVKEKMERFTE